MNELRVFKFQGMSEIRFIDDMPIANDVALALGYSPKNLANTIRKKVFTGNKGVAKMATPGGIQEITVLKEAGIYQLIFSSKLESAQKFQQWVFEDVLPTIRKQGFYADLNNNLTSLSKEDVFGNMVAFAAELRKQLPAHYTINDYGVLIGFKGDHARPYFDTINKKGLPAVYVDGKSILFDWMGTQSLDKSRVDALMNKLRDMCKSYGRPFRHGETYQVIKGFKSTEEAQRAANQIERMSFEVMNGRI